MKLSLAKKWLSLTYMGTLPFLTHVFEVVLAKSKLQLLMGILALVRKDQHSQAPHQWSWVPVLGVSLLRVRDSHKSEGLKSQVLVVISIRQQITCIQKLIFFWFCLFFNLFPWKKGQILLNSTYQTKCSFPYHCPIVKSGYSFTHKILCFCYICFDRLCNIICL